MLGGCSVIINIQALGASYLGCCCLEICIPSPTSNFRFLENIFAQINVDDKNTVVRIVLNFKMHSTISINPEFKSPSPLSKTRFYGRERACA